MKYSVQYSSRFKKSLKRIRAIIGFKPEKLKEVIGLLAGGETLPASFRDHKLKGLLQDHRECHISPDILLVYKIENDLLILTLVNIGSHSQLFK